MDWRIKASLQKVLSLTRIGDKLNHIPATLNKNYHKNVVAYQFHECIRKFNHSDLDLNKPNAALEIGTGYSLISPIVLSLLGFDEIVTVDIDQDVRLSTLKKQLRFLEQEKYIEQIAEIGIYSIDEVKEKLINLRMKSDLKSVLSKCNIVYKAPYSLKDIDSLSNDGFDYIYSQVVFEHIPPEILEELFSRFKVWLKNTGYSVHTINFIDHYANPGFFQDRKISEFNFLRFSDSYWRFWSGNPIAYTNRLSYRYYYELFEKNNFKTLNFIGENYRPHIPISLESIHVDVLKKYKKTPELEELTGYQRGTFVAQK